MKICPKCGVSQKDSNRTCVDCGAVLGKPISEDAAYCIEKERREKIESVSNNLDELSMGRFKVPLIVTFIGCIVGAIVIAVLGELDVIPFSEFQWLFVSIPFSIVGLVNVVFPQLSWKLELMRLSWYVDTSDASPSFYYVFMHKLAVWLCLVFSVGCIITYFCCGNVVKPNFEDTLPQVDRYVHTTYGGYYID